LLVFLCLKAVREALNLESELLESDSSLII
jgi:hypothetical protein